jgi:hypothetical protein
MATETFRLVVSGPVSVGAVLQLRFNVPNVGQNLFTLCGQPQPCADRPYESTFDHLPIAARVTWNFELVDAQARVIAVFGNGAEELPANSVTTASYEFK